MKILLDEDVPRKLVHMLADHDTSTVAGMGWAGIKNGELLRRVEASAFEVFITGDKNMKSQQRLIGRPFSVLVLSAVNWSVIRLHVNRIAEAIDRWEAGTIHFVDCGLFVPRKRL